MDKHSRTKIKNIKSKVTEMLVERELLRGGDEPVVSPSKYWADFCSYFDYMLGLPEESFSKLRVHTYHLTGDNYQIYLLQDPENYKAIADSLTKNIPSWLILNEPEGGIGFSYDDGRFISRDIIRYQRVVNTLYRYGILSDVSSTDNQQRHYVFEIGAGYGGLAHHLSNVMRNVTYIIVDLPETLLFSASYLSLLNPHKSIYIYDSSNFSEFLHSSDVGSYDFVLIPNYRLLALRHLLFELVINVASFQEMRTEQIDAYLDFVCEVCTGVLYSWNRDKHPRNSELSTLSGMLSTRFELTEVLQLNTTKEEIEATERMKLKLRRALKSLAVFVGLLDPSGPGLPSLYPSYTEYICKPLPEIGLKTECEE